MKNIENAIRIPDSDDYDRNIKTANDRRTSVTVGETAVVKCRHYRIGKMNYTVNSIFAKDIDINNNIKYLIAKDID